MSTKKWKDNELKTLLTEQWGFSMNLDGLAERKADDWGKNPEAFTGTEKEEEEEEEDVKTGKALEEDAAIQQKCKTMCEWKHGPSRNWASDPTSEGAQCMQSCVESGPSTSMHEESRLFEEAVGVCKKQHEVLGDKAVRECIENQMTSIMNEAFGHDELYIEEGMMDSIKNIFQRGCGTGECDARMAYCKARQLKENPPGEEYKLAELSEDEWLAMVVHMFDSNQCKGEQDMATQRDYKIAREKIRRARGEGGPGEAKGVGRFTAKGQRGKTGTDLANAWRCKNIPGFDADNPEICKNLEERHKPDNVRQGREPGRRKKNIKTGVRSLDEEQFQLAVKRAMEIYKESKR